MSPLKKHLQFSLRLYFTALAVVIIVFFSRMLPFLVEQHFFLPWPIFWLDFFPNQKIVVYFTYAALLLNTLLLIRFPWSFALRFLNFLFLFFIIPMYYLSAGRTFHEFYAWLITGFFLLAIRKNAEDSFNAMVWKFTQASLLFIYFLSGTWKLRKAAESLLNGISFFDLSESLGHNIATNFMFGGSLPPVGMWLINSPPSLQLALWISVVFIETFVILSIWKTRWLPYSAVLLISMHAGAYLAMEISYAPTVILIFTILLAEPILRKKARV